MSVSSVCAFCSAPSKLRCSACKSIAYCSVEHQKLDWKNHKIDCRKIQETRVPIVTKPCLLLKLPPEVLHIVAYFLLKSDQEREKVFVLSLDLINFLNCNKVQFLQWKKSVQIIKLNRPHSAKYLASAKFRNRVLEAVSSPKQICLEFVRPEIMEKSLVNRSKPTELDLSPVCGVREVTMHDCYLPSLTPITDVEELTVVDCAVTNLSFCSTSSSLKSLYFSTRLSDPIDVGCLGNHNTLEELTIRAANVMNYQSLFNLKTLRIENYSNLVDVSCFQNIPSLVFCYCEALTDVNCLGNVSELKIQYCAGVVNVSGLGKVRSLDLSGCENIVDVSSLGQVHDLNLSKCRRIQDVSALTHVVKLDISDLNQVTDVSGLRSVQELNLSRCSLVPNVTMLSQVRVLDISLCPLVTDLSDLSALKELTMRSGSNRAVALQGLETLGQLTKASLGEIGSPELIFPHLNRSNLKELQLYNWTVPSIGLENVTSLRLSNCKLSMFSSAKNEFSRLRSLEITTCNDRLILPTHLPSLGYLKISYCRSLSVLVIPQGNDEKYPIYQVEIFECESLQQIKVSNRRVSLMEIFGCESLSKVTGSRFIGRLFIDDPENVAVR
jgi:hypothetical protein